MTIRLVRETRPKKPILMLITLALIVAGCIPLMEESEDQGNSTVAPDVEAVQTQASTASGDIASDYRNRPLSAGFTYQQPDGNRFVAGRGMLPDIEPLDIKLSGRPIWVVAAPQGEGSIWVAILEDGRAEGYKVQGITAEPIVVEPPRLPPEMPPMLILEDGVPVLLATGADAASELTHAVPLNTPPTSIAYVAKTGDILVEQNDEAFQIPADALLDARVLVDESDRLLVLSDPTTRYGHGVLGDGVEAGGFKVLDTSQSPQVSMWIQIQGERVVEGISPIWADLDGDGIREIIVTESDSEQGAQIVAYDEQGNRAASGPAIERGFRWRHQLAVAPFGPNGEIELAAILTPHIGGVVEFYRRQGDQLEIVAQVPGYSSHIFGSRNLDQAIAGDLDGDGRIELLVPDQAQEVLGAIRRDPDGASAVWALPLEGRLATNLAGATLASGDIVLGVGREDGVLRLWTPMGVG